MKTTNETHNYFSNHQLEQRVYKCLHYKEGFFKLFNKINPDNAEQAISFCDLFVKGSLIKEPEEFVDDLDKLGDEQLSDLKTLIKKEDNQFLFNENKQEFIDALYSLKVSVVKKTNTKEQGVDKKEEGVDKKVEEKIIRFLCGEEENTDVKFYSYRDDKSENVEEDDYRIIKLTSKYIEDYLKVNQETGVFKDAEIWNNLVDFLINKKQELFVAEEAGSDDKFIAIKEDDLFQYIESLDERKDNSESPNISFGDRQKLKFIAELSDNELPLLDFLQEKLKIKVKDNKDQEVLENTQIQQDQEIPQGLPEKKPNNIFKFEHKIYEINGIKHCEAKYTGNKGDYGTLAFRVDNDFELKTEKERGDYLKGIIISSGVEGSGVKDFNRGDDKDDIRQLNLKEGEDIKFGVAVNRGDEDKIKIISCNIDNEILHDDAFKDAIKNNKIEQFFYVKIGGQESVKYACFELYFDEQKGISLKPHSCAELKQGTMFTNSIVPTKGSNAGKFLDQDIKNALNNCVVKVTSTVKEFQKEVYFSKKFEDGKLESENNELVSSEEGSNKVNDTQQSKKSFFQNILKLSSKKSTQKVKPKSLPNEGEPKNQIIKMTAKTLQYKEENKQK